MLMLMLWVGSIPGMRQEMHQKKILQRARSTREESATILVSKAKISDISYINELFLKVPLIDYFAKVVQKADLGVNAVVVLLICLILFTGSYLLMRSYNMGATISFMFSFFVAILPLFAIHLKIQQRQKEFEKHFVEGLNIIKNALKAGQGLTAALNIVSQDAPWPIDVEFRKLLAEVEYGFPFHEALDRLDHRIELDELSFFVSTIKIQQKAGGNLSEVIENIEETIRTRFELKREVNTLSAQGKMSGMVLVSIPVLLFVALSIMNPGFFEPLLEETFARYMLYFLIAWGGVGVYLIMKIVNIKV
jgi:tight adherence protein B